MSDKPKTIQEALAEVQNNVEINEIDFQKAFAAAYKKNPGGTMDWNGKKIALKLATDKPQSSTPHGAPGLAGPSARVTRLDAPIPAPRPNTYGPRPPNEQGPSIPKTDKVPGASTGDLTPKPASTPEINKADPGRFSSYEPKTYTGGSFKSLNLPNYDRSSVNVSDTTKEYRRGEPTKTQVAPPPAPLNTSTPNSSNSVVLKKPEESESGGNKKKMSEEMNPLIAAFLKLQDENPSNMFEAAKKAKKDYDKDGKVESPKDEVWGSRFAAAKKAGKMEEGSLDPKDSDATPASKTITKAKPAEDPSTPKSYPGAASSLTPDNPTTKRMSNAVKEEEEFEDLDEGHSFYASNVGGRVKMHKPGTMLKHEKHGTVSVVSSDPGHKDFDASSDRNPKGMKGPSYKVKDSKGQTHHIDLESDWGLSDKPIKTKKVNVKEAEQIDEIGDTAAGRSVLKNYIKKAGGSTTNSAVAHQAMSSDAAPGGQLHKTSVRKTVNRVKGVERAADRLESVEFSQSEIDHINSFFEAVAPSRPEPTKGVNPTVKNTDLTDETLEEGRPKKNPTPETTDRDPRQHIQVMAGRAAAGNVLDFKHENGKTSKLTPGMGRSITAHLNSLKPADRQKAVNKMHASPEGLKV